MYNITKGQDKTRKDNAMDKEQQYIERIRREEEIRHKERQRLNDQKSGRIFMFWLCLFVFIMYLISQSG